MLLGMERYEWESINLQQKPIAKINIFKKQGSEAYLRGFEIVYSDGSSVTANSKEGELAHTVDFEQNDEFVGMTMKVTTEDDKRPRQLGFTLMRNGSGSASSASPAQQVPAAMSMGS